MQGKRHSYPSDITNRRVPGSEAPFDNLCAPSKYIWDKTVQNGESDCYAPIEHETSATSHKLRGNDLVRSAHRLTAEVDATLHCMHQDDGDASGDKPTTSSESKGTDARASPVPPLTQTGKGKGLRHLSRQVVETLSQKGTTTYQEVADELVQDAKRQASLDCDDGELVPDFDEKNIRRRVYDALNVLKALGAIEHEKKDIRWMGLSLQTVDKRSRSVERDRICEEIAKKNMYLKDLLDQYTTVCNLLKRNHEHAAEPDAVKFALPFVVVQTTPAAEVDVDIDDAKLVAQIDFVGTPFSLFDDTFVLKNLGLCDKHPSREGNTSRMGRATQEPSGT